MKGGEAKINYLNGVIQFLRLIINKLYSKTKKKNDSHNIRHSVKRVYILIYSFN